MKPATQNMDRICKVIGRMRLSLDSLSGEELACAVWASAVGPKIAKHSRASKLVRTHLIVEVEDATWQRNLNSLSKTILRNIEHAVGTGLVDGLEFRVMPRRREPARAAESMPALFADESNAIADPVLRGIYRASRKKTMRATA